MSSVQDDRPVLVGMNNPYGSEPKYALYPYPENSAGGRLYAMFCEAYERQFGCDFPGKRRAYLDGFDRRNVLTSKHWLTAAAKREGVTLAATLAGRSVVVLGRSVARSLGVPPTPWFEVQDAVVQHGPLLTKFRVWTIPHPSGRCREYNDPATRARAGDLLHGLYQGWVK